MKPKPAFLLLALVIGCAAFLYFLWQEGQVNEVCCQEKQEISPKNEEGGDFQSESFTRLIAFSRSSY